MSPAATWPAASASDRLARITAAMGPAGRHKAARRAHRVSPAEKAHLCAETARVRSVMQGELHACMQAATTRSTTYRILQRGADGQHADLRSRFSVQVRPVLCQTRFAVGRAGRRRAGRVRQPGVDGVADRRPLPGAPHHALDSRPPSDALPPARHRPRRPGAVVRASATAPTRSTPTSSTRCATNPARSSNSVSSRRQHPGHDRASGVRAQQLDRPRHPRDDPAAPWHRPIRQEPTTCRG